MKRSWETLEARVKRHASIPLKQKMLWLTQMLDFANRNQTKLRRQLRLASR